MDPFIIYAHRGASAAAPENTMAAFQEAYRQGAFAIECDIQMTKDGVPVILHDEFLDRTTNGTGMIHQYSYHEIKDLDAGSWFGSQFRNERIPTLEQFLHWVRTTPLLINLELKTGLIEHPQIEEAVVDLLSQYRMIHRTVISSYNLRTLSKIRKLNPQIETAVLYFYLNQPWQYAKAVGASAIHAFYPLLTQDVVLNARKEKIKVIPYTVDASEDIRRMIRMNVSGIITNYPKRAEQIAKHLQKIRTRFL